MPDSIIRGVTAAGKRKLQKIARQANARADKERRARAEQRQIRLRDAAEPYRAALEAALRKNPGYKRYQKAVQAYAAEVKKIIAASSQDREAYLASLEKAQTQWAKRVLEYGPMFDRAYNDSVQAAAYLSDMVRVIRGDERITVSELPVGTLVVVSLLTPEDGETPPTSFRCPPPFEDGEKSNDSFLGGIHMASSFNAATGEVTGESAAAEAGDARASSVVGSFITVPSGFSRMTVTAQIRADWGAASTSVGAISWAEVDGRTSLIVGNDSPWWSSEFGYSMAPIGWHAAINETKVYTISDPYIIPNSGGEMMVRAGVGTECMAVGAFGVATARVTATVQEIRVELS